MRAAYFDCYAGVSGDMILGALVDAGLSLEALSHDLGKLPLTGYRLAAERQRRGPLAGTKLTVVLTDSGQEQPARTLSPILSLIQPSGLSPGVKAGASQVFRILAAAEAKVHGVTPEEVHFHEVGAVDAIVDIVGAVAGLELLGVEAVYASSLPAGQGLVTTAQGLLPLPAPATLELLAQAKAPTHPVPSVQPPLGELVTPTGAAILAALATFQQPSMTIERVGYGLGSRDHPALPNALRLWLGETAPSSSSSISLGVNSAEGLEEVLLLETNIDDMSPELLGYVQERLLALGAYDVWFSPIQMKKNRPAVKLCVLSRLDLEGAMVETVLAETTTLGVRVQRMARHRAERREERFESSLGPVSVKIKLLKGVPVAASPEYEDCRRLAQKHALPLQEVYRIVEAEARTKLISQVNK